MEYKPFEHKLVAVLNKNIPQGRAMNALAHMALGLGASVSNREHLRLQDYVDADAGVHPSISDIPFIVLRAGPGQLRTLRNDAISLGLTFTDFTGTMLEGTYIEQHQRTRETKEADLAYLGICLFADWDTLSELTKKFSLWK